MKKATLLVFILSMVSVLYAQEITFKFTSEQTCSFVPLDSILVENISLGGDSVLYYPDTTLTFVFSGIKENYLSNSNFQVKQNFPNPFEAKTYFQINVPEKDDFVLKIYDLYGRQLVSTIKTLEQGLHTFSFTGTNSQSYILAVGSDKYLSKILMIQVGSSNSDIPTLNYIENSDYISSKSFEKNILSSFDYNIGNNLRLTGFINENTDVIYATPIESTDYLFEFANSVPFQPSFISGNQNICLNAQELTYSVINVEDVVYNWLVPSGWSIISGQGTNEIIVNSGTESGTISVFASNNCGISTTRNLNVLISSIIPNVSSNSPICQLETIQLSVDNGVSWFWTGPDEFSSTAQNPEIVAFNTSSGSLYYVTITDSYGCSFTGSTNVIVFDIPNPSAYSNSPVCMGESINLSVDIGESWHWLGQSEFESYTQYPTFTALTLSNAGDYSVTVTDVNGCTGTSTTSLVVNSTPNPIATSNSPICNLETLELFVNDGVNWIWSGTGGFTSTNQNPIIVSASTVNSGNYSVTVSDNNGCTSNSVVSVNISVPLIPSAADNDIGEEFIIWKWNMPPNCLGFKYNTVNNLATAIDIGLDTSFNQTSLTCGESHNLFVWAYNNCGESEVLILAQNTLPCFVCGSTIFDINGNSYNTVQIGGQCWMSQNLKTTHYNDGEVIPNVIGNTAWSTLSTGAWCYYNNNSTYNTDFGKLYNYYAVETERLCPEGWVIPQLPSLQVQQDGWGTLTEYLIANGYNYDGSIISNKIAKSLASNEYWESSTNVGAIGNDISLNNSSGFNANPGSWRSTNGEFSPYNGDINQQTTWWAGSQETYSLFYVNNYSTLYSDGYSKQGHSVRCLKECDLPSEPTEGVHSVQHDQIIWNWSGDENTIGYKYILTLDLNNNYSDAIDIGSTTTFTVNNLECDTEYHFYVWAYNGCGSSLVKEFSQITSTVECPSTMNDSEGNSYNVVKIGCQCWMSENLKYLPSVSGSSTVSTTNPLYYVYGYNGTLVSHAKNFEISGINIYNRFGVLYNWSSAMNACPTGWHLPADNEWTELENYLAENGYNYDGTFTSDEETDATKRLRIGKSLASTSYWNSSASNGSVGNNLLLNNTSGFNAQPGGYLFGGNFQNQLYNTAFWTSTYQCFRLLNYQSGGIQRNEYLISDGYSVRCIKDE